MRMKPAAAVALLALVGAVTAVRTAGSAGAAPAACHPVLSLVAHGQGSPDDLAWDGRELLVSDINQGTIGVVRHGQVHTLVSHLHEPEGIVPGPHNTLIVAEQATNSVVEIDLAKRIRVTLAKLPLPKGKSGIDGINADGRAAVFVPDSARGRLYVLHLPSRRLSLLARAMIRPVAATNWAGAVVVADEYANAVWRLGRKRTRLAKVGLPDDFAVISHHLIAVSLLGAVWEVAPHLRMLSSAFAPTATDPQGLAPDGPGAVLVADQGRNAIYRLGGLAHCL
jgi:hypothetical protein